MLWTLAIIGVVPALPVAGFVVGDCKFTKFIHRHLFHFLLGCHWLPPLVAIQGEASSVPTKRTATGGQRASSRVGGARAPSKAKPTRSGAVPDAIPEGPGVPCHTRRASSGSVHPARYAMANCTVIPRWSRSRHLRVRSWADDQPREIRLWSAVGAPIGRCGRRA